MTRRARILRPLKFAVVGATGVAVNSAVLHMGYKILGLPLAIASPIAIAVAIFTNFSGNNAWTWRRSEPDGRGAYARRLGRYYLSSLLGALINYGLLLLLVERFAVSHLIANLAGILAGTASNYLLSEFWVFGRSTKEAEGSAGA